MRPISCVPLVIRKASWPCGALKVILCREDGFDYEMVYQLNAGEKSAILNKMDQYGQEK